MLLKWMTHKKKCVTSKVRTLPDGNCPLSIARPAVFCVSIAFLCTHYLEFQWYKKPELWFVLDQTKGKSKVRTWVCFLTRWSWIVPKTHYLKRSILRMFSFPWYFCGWRLVVSHVSPSFSLVAQNSTSTNIIGQSIRARTTPPFSKNIPYSWPWFPSRLCPLFLATLLSRLGYRKNKPFWFNKFPKWRALWITRIAIIRRFLPRRTTFHPPRLTTCPFRKRFITCCPIRRSMNAPFRGCRTDVRSKCIVRSTLNVTCVPSTLDMVGIRAFCDPSTIMVSNTLARA